MPWFKTLKKTRKPSQHPLPSNAAPQTNAGPSSISVGLNRGVGSVRVDDGNAPGCDRETERERRGETIRKSVAAPADDAKKPTHESRLFKSVLADVSAIYAHCEEAAQVSNKVEDLISHIIALEELCGAPAGDLVEQGRRTELTRKLRDIEARFQSLYEKPLPQQLQDYGYIPNLLEDLREVIFDYRIAQQRELYVQGYQLMSTEELVILSGFPRSHGAELSHGNWRGCLKGTRGDVLDKIELWTRNFSEPPVFWLNGQARTGKTAIAQTIAKRVFADGQLGAFFICPRNFEDPDNLRLIFPTLAVQLARKYADFRSLFIPLVQSHPGIAQESLDNQMQKLIVRPLQVFDISTVAIIDALDESKDEGSPSAILSVLARFLSDIPKVKFLITARPETHIREGFRLPLLEEATSVFVLHEVEKSQVDDDVRLLFRRELSEVGLLGNSNWARPLSEGELNDLSTQAAGSFVYAVAAVKFINPRSSNSIQRFNSLTESSRRSAHETKKRHNEDRALDLFYELILQGAFPDRRNLENDPKICSVLGAIVVAANPLSPSTVGALLGLDVDEVFRLLSLARPLLIPQNDTHIAILPFHKSFLSFIVDPDRCTNKRFRISPSDHNTRLLMGCVNLMVRTLEGGMCQLPDGAANEDIGDLRQRIERYIDPALIYACKSWHLHLVDRHKMSADTPGITLTICRFLETKFLFWLEVLSVLGAVGNAVDALQAMADWLEESPTLDLVNDCSRFVTSYFEIISASSPHIYHSALVFTPKSSIVRNLYEAHARPFTRVVCGLPRSWDSATLAIWCPFRVSLVVWSPCNRYLAISPRESVTVTILDSTTLRQVQNLEFSPKIPLLPLALIFSPDGRVLTCSCAGLSSDQELCVVSWNVRTGGTVSIVEQRGPLSACLSGKPIVTYSADGRMIGILYWYHDSTLISIYNVVSGIHLYDVRNSVQINPSFPAGMCFYHIWTHGQSLRFVTAGSATITIWEVGFTAHSTPTKVATLSVPQHVQLTGIFEKFSPYDTPCFQFIPASHRLVLTGSAQPALQILAWNLENPEPLFVNTDNRFQFSRTFSADGRFLASSTVSQEIYLWKESPTGYVLAAKLPTSTQHPSSIISPDGESIIVYGDSTVQLWRTNAFTTTTTTTATATTATMTTSSTTTTPSASSVSTRPRPTEDFVLEFHPIKPLAAFAWRNYNTATILDLHSGLPQLTINTGVRVLGIRVVEDAVIIVGDREVVAWKLPEGSRLPDATMEPQDRAGTVLFKLSHGWKNGAIAASISFDLSHVALITQCIFGTESRYLHVYSASTGQTIGYALVEGETPWLAPGGLDIWCSVGDKTEVWTVTGTGLHKSTYTRPVDGGSWELPWIPSRGYQATKYGWILGPGGKRLLMLPPPLRPSAMGQVWKGKYLALLHGSLPEPIILELKPLPTLLRPY